MRWSRCWRSRHRTTPTPTRGNGWTKSIATVQRGHRLLAAWRGAGLDTPELGRHTVQQLQRWLDNCDRIMERTIAEQAHATLGSLAAAELVPCADPQVEAELNRLDGAGSDLEPDELEQVQHALDRLQAKEQLDPPVRRPVLTRPVLTRLQERIVALLGVQRGVLAVSRHHVGLPPAIRTDAA